MAAQTATFKLTPWQLDNLSKPLVKMVMEQIEAFYRDPINEQGFQKWLKENAVTKKES